MISALVVPILLALGPGPAVATPPAQDDPAIRVSLNNKGRYQRGDRAKVEVRTREDGYLLVLHVDPDRRLRVLFPLDPKDDNFVRGRDDIEIVGRGDREAFRVDGAGQGLVYAAVSKDPFRFADYEVGDHWDFRALNAVRLGDDLEADLNDFVRGIAARDFDYDLMQYDVYDQVVYSGSSTYVTQYYYGPMYRYPYSSTYYDDWCFGYWGCGYGGRTSIFIGIGFGHRFRPFYYDPFFYDPFYYRPFVYRPYRPVFIYPYPVYVSPYRPRAPYIWRPYDYYHGGYYTTAPWRRREPGFGTSTYAWGGSYVPGRLARGLAEDGWRDRSTAGTTVTSLGSTYVAPRRASEARPRDLTPARGESRRPDPGTVVTPERSGARPEGHRSPARREPGAAAPLPQRVGPTLEPRRLDDGAARSMTVPEARRADDDVPAVRGADEGGYEMPRVISPRSPERRAAEARPAEPRSSDPGSDDMGRPQRGPTIDRSPSPPPRVDRGRAPESRPRMDPGRRDGPPARVAPPSRGSPPARGSAPAFRSRN
jgi:hypothetical protein